MFAPGSFIYSTVPDNGYEYMSGTSMACPQVAGLAALVRTLKSGLNGQQVRNIIESNVKKSAAYTPFVSTGGLIDVEKTIEAAGK